MNNPDDKIEETKEGDIMEDEVLKLLGLTKEDIKKAIEEEDEDTWFGLGRK